jgi:nicotinamide-nucleotide amidase
MGQSEMAMNLVEQIAAKLRERNQTLAIAESLTGGLLASKFTELPGASHFFLGGFITYSIDSKISLLGVERDLIEGEGVVSRAVAIAMAQGAQSRLKSGWAVATTGVAGPGPSHSIPAGQVWIALTADSISTPVTRELSLGEIGRDAVREASVQAALEILLQELLR